MSNTTTTEDNEKSKTRGASGKTSLKPTNGTKEGMQETKIRGASLKPTKSTDGTPASKNESKVREAPSTSRAKPKDGPTANKDECKEREVSAKSRTKTKDGPPASKEESKERESSAKSRTKTKDGPQANKDESEEREASAKSKTKAKYGPPASKEEIKEREASAKSKTKTKDRPPASKEESKEREASAKSKTKPKDGPPDSKEENKERGASAKSKTKPKYGPPDSKDESKEREASAISKTQTKDVPPASKDESKERGASAKSRKKTKDGPTESKDESKEREASAKSRTKTKDGPPASKDESKERKASAKSRTKTTVGTPASKDDNQDQEASAKSKTKPKDGPPDSKDESKKRGASAKSKTKPKDGPPDSKDESIEREASAKSRTKPNNGPPASKDESKEREASAKSKTKPTDGPPANKIESKMRGASAKCRTQPTEGTHKRTHGVSPLETATSTMFDEIKTTQPNGFNVSSEAKAIFNTGDLDDLVDRMLEQNVITHSHDPDKDVKKFFDDEVKMTQTDKNHVQKPFEILKDKVKGQLNVQTNFGGWECHSRGSHADKTKVAWPDEMDWILSPRLDTKLRAIFDDCRPGFCKIRVGGELMEEELKQFCDELKGDKYLNARKYREYIFNKLEDIVKNDRKLSDIRKYPDTLSFAIKYTGIPTETGMKSFDIDFVPSLAIRGWPDVSVARDILCTLKDDDKARKIKEKGFNVTPRQCTAGPEHKRDTQWQVAFSYAEYKLTFHVAGCWKPIMRTLKRVVEIAHGTSDFKSSKNSNQLEQIKRASDFIKQNSDLKFSPRISTYHIRTLMWTLRYDLTAGEHVWSEHTTSNRLMFTLEKFRKMMTGEMVVPHFFLPKVENILQSVSLDERKFLYMIARVTEIIFSMSVFYIR